MFDMNMDFLVIVWTALLVCSPKVSIVAFLLNDHTTDRCPVKTSTTYAYGDYCFEFVLGSETYWHDAKRICEHQGGYLATVDTPDVQSFIMDRLKNLRFGHNGIWIGLNDEADELHWKWADGTPLGSFRYWASGQGNNIITHNIEDCVHLRFTDNGHWHDSPCDSLGFKYNYICQFHFLPTQPTTQTTSTTPKPTTPIITASLTRTPKPTTKSSTVLTTTTTTTTPQPTTTTTTPTIPTTAPLPTTTTLIVATSSTTSTPTPSTTTTVQLIPSITPSSTTTTMLPTMPEVTTKAAIQGPGLETLPPCVALVCGLDCGLLGFVTGNDGCPTCACAT